jgi:hypothetical protein
MPEHICEFNVFQFWVIQPHKKPSKEGKHSERRGKRDNHHLKFKDPPRFPEEIPM